jgi:AraC family transcriptional regulator of adaptative response/methylated-DNA-[protein]-cysteine methyltransferase
MKKQIRQFLQHRDFSALADMASRRRRVLDLLVPLTFDSDPLVGWRAVEGMGVAADRIAEDDPDRVRQHLRRLYWLLSEESGGICWRAPEAMAEIVRLRPRIFADYIPIVVSLIDQMADEDLVHFRPGILWAIGRLGHLAEEEVEASLSTITACLDHPDCQVRGAAAWCLRESGHGEIPTGRVDLLSDPGPVEIYKDGDLVRTTVGRLVREAVVAAD